jgi:hypothetical protein
LAHESGPRSQSLASGVRKKAWPGLVDAEPFAARAQLDWRQGERDFPSFRHPNSLRIQSVSVAVRACSRSFHWVSTMTCTTVVFDAASGGRGDVKRANLVEPASGVPRKDVCETRPLLASVRSQSTGLAGGDTSPAVPPAKRVRASSGRTRARRNRTMFDQIVFEDGLHRF